MTADTLRRAASLMRERADGASPGPWAHIDEAPCGTPIAYSHVKAGDWLVADCGTADDMAAWNAPHIASWHPGVALAVADWLDREADGQDLVDSVERVSVEIDGEVEVVHSTYPEALAVARAYLGGES